MCLRLLLKSKNMVSPCVDGFAAHQQIALMRWVMLLSTLGYASRNRLTSLPKLGEVLDSEGNGHAQMDKECINLLFILLKYYLSLTA